MQELAFEKSGFIIWPNEPFIDGYASGVAGIEPTPASFANNYDFRNA